MGGGSFSIQNHITSTTNFNNHHPCVSVMQEQIEALRHGLQGQMIILENKLQKDYQERINELARKIRFVENKISRHHAMDRVLSDKSIHSQVCD